VSLGQASGNHTVEFRTYMPGGALYQSQAVPISIRMGQGVGPSTRALAGYPFPVAVQQPAPEVTRTATGMLPTGPALVNVTARMPVAGTPIINSSLYGDWRVEAYLDGATRACATTVFHLQ